MAGLLVGSFLNVCIFRLPAGEGVVAGRSHCNSCGKTLHWWELIPLLSYLALRGRCAKCKTHISVQYPIIESANALLWMLVFHRFGMGANAALGCLLLSTLLVVAVIDARTKIIPQKTTVFIGILGAVRLLCNHSAWAEHLLGLVCISGLLLLLLLCSGGSAIGGGDVKLMAGAGLFLGLAQSLFAFFLGCLIGCLVHIPRMKFFGASRELALGPYLAIGIAVAFLFGDDILQWYFTLFL